MHPAVIVEQLVNTGAPFRKGKKTPSGFPLDAHRYAEMFTSILSGSAFRHKLGTAGISTFSFTSKKLNGWFGNGGFRKLNSYLGLIEASGTYGYTDIKTTKEYWVSPQGRSFLESCRQITAQGYTGSLYQKDGRRIRKGTNGILSQDKRGTPAVSNARIRWAMPINMEATEAALNTGLRCLFPDTDTERLESMEQQLRLVYICANNDRAGRGLLPQTYREDSSGRLNSLGGISIQNIHKELRDIILAGTHEYDFENCHWRILHQKAGIESPAIENYTQNCKQIRQGIADRVGITEDEAKQALLSLLFGVTQGKSTYYSSLPKLLGREAAERLYADPDWKALHGAVKESRSAMIAQAEAYVGGGRRAGKTINVRGKGRTGKPAKLLAHLLQGWEAELLHLVLYKYGDNVILLQHDGWGMQTYVEPTEIKAMITRRTGLNMPITHKILIAPKKRIIPEHE